MDDTHKRLIGVFTNAFPDLLPDRIPSATQENTPSWDSVAAITLMNLIEEEFSIQIDFDDLGDLSSFSKIETYLEHKSMERQ